MPCPAGRPALLHKLCFDDFCASSPTMARTDQEGPVLAGANDRMMMGDSRRGDRKRAWGAERRSNGPYPSGGRPLIVRWAT